MEKAMEEIQAAVAELRAAQSVAAAKLAQTDKRQATTDAKLDAILAKLNISGNFSGGDDDPENGSSTQEEESSPVLMPQKMELPGFDGSDARAWLSRVEQYFLVHKVAATKKVELAVITLSGSAMAWYQLLIRRLPNPDWATFQQELLIRYGDESAINGYEALIAVKQTGSLEEYIAAFENRVSQIADFSDAHYLGFFLGGLKKQLRAQIQDGVVGSYSAPLQAARKLDHASSPTPSASFTTRSTSALSYSAQPTYNKLTHGTTSPASASSDPHPNRNVRHLTAEETREYRAKGKCYRCGERYGPFHKCASKHLSVMITAEGDDQEEIEGKDELLPIYPT